MQACDAATTLTKRTLWDKQRSMRRPISEHVTSSAAQRTARMLLESGALVHRPDAPFVLHSGRKSPVRIDCRRLIAFPRLRRHLVEIAADTLADRFGLERFDAIAGGETAGIPYAAWLADRFMLPMLYVRKSPKGFGRNARIEGRLAEGQRVLLVDDVTTDGTSLLGFADALRDAGARVDHAFVILDHDLDPQHRSALAGAGLEVLALTTAGDLLEEARASTEVTADAVASLERFLVEPPSAAGTPG